MSEKLQMNAYYFSFNETSEKSINEILSAVAVAGDKYHHTDEWSNEGLIEIIQNKSDLAANDLTALRKELSEKEMELEFEKLAKSQLLDVNLICEQRDGALRSRDAWRAMAARLASVANYLGHNNRELLSDFEALKASEATKEGER